jgi:O-antigen ligase
LAIAFALLLGDVFQVVGALSRFALWLIWGFIWVLIVIILRRERVSFLQAIRGPAPWLVGYVLYLAFGTLSSSLSAASEAFRLLVLAFTIHTGFSVLIRGRKDLSLFAGVAQFSLLLNVALCQSMRISPAAVALLNRIYPERATTQLVTDRLGGLWLNPNVAGLATLVILTLTIWRSGALAWITRLAGLWMLYFTVSRTGIYSLIAILVILAVCLRRSLRWQKLLPLGFAAIGILVLGVVGSSLFPDAGKAGLGERAERFITRIANYREEGAKAGSRLDNITNWGPTILSTPWCGRGLLTSRGGGFRGEVYRTDVPYMGVHNMYLGIYIDTGWPGVLVVGFIILYALCRAWGACAWLAAVDRAGMLSFWLLLLLYGMVMDESLWAMEPIALWALAIHTPLALADEARSARNVMCKFRARANK